MKRKNAPSSSGFTLVELVMVIILIGVLSALGIGLLASPGAYSAGAARDQFVSSALLAQKRALANNTGSFTSLTLKQDAEEWLFQVSQGVTTFPERKAAREGADLRIDGSTVGNGTTRTFQFNSDGSLNSGNNIQFEFDGTSTHDACLSSLGFSYPQECQR